MEKIKYLAKLPDKSIPSNYQPGLRRSDLLLVRSAAILAFGAGFTLCAGLTLLHSPLPLVAAPVAAPTLIRGATIYTGDGAVRKGDLSFGADGRILPSPGQAAGPRPGPAVDGRGKILTPGFIDIATGLGLVDVSYLPAARDDSAGGGIVRAAFRVSDVFDPRSPVIPVARSQGITSVLAVPTGGLVAGQSAWADLAGGPENRPVLARDSAALHVALDRPAAGGHGGQFLRLQRLYDDLALFRADKLAFPIGREHPVGRLDFESLARFQDGGGPVFFRVDRAAHIRSVLAFARKQRLRPVITGGAEAWLAAQELAAAKTPVVLNPIRNLPSSFDARAARADAAAILARAGVPVILSTFDTHRVGILRQLAGNAVRAGLPYQTALRAITLEPARALGMEADYGSLRPGRLANLALWSGDPFEPSSRLEALWIRGRRVSLQSRQTELLERYRKL